ncbi:MAG: YtxH domain-containing protein [Campylobacteraceae bacterium]|nr:YtxH domain-containing protein [Campylobacteraceae bacterium]
MNKYDTNIENSRSMKNVNTNPYINKNDIQVENQSVNTQNTSSGFNQGDFIKGALIGAAVTFLLTNKGAQDTIMNAASKGSELFQAGMEEMKERYEDARAQMEANKD